MKNRTKSGKYLARMKANRGGRKQPTSPLRVDPTRTATLRRVFLGKIRRQFAILKYKIDELIRVSDYMHLDSTKTVLNASQPAYTFGTSTDRLRSFQYWLKAQLQSHIIGQTEHQIWDEYVQEGFKKGAGRAFDDTKVARPKKGSNKPRVKADTLPGTAQTKEEFLRSSFGQPVAVEKAQLLAARTFDELEAITTDMSNRISRTLVDGLVQGKGPREVARELKDEVDIGRGRAEKIARTELIRAHAEGQLIALEQMGVKEVGAQVEWSTAGDSLVCPKCANLEGKTMPISKAKGMLPLHPNCRCCWMPAFPEIDTVEEKDNSDVNSVHKNRRVQDQESGNLYDDSMEKKTVETSDTPETLATTEVETPTYTTPDSVHSTDEHYDFDDLQLDDSPVVPIYESPPPTTPRRKK